MLDSPSTSHGSLTMPLPVWLPTWLTNLLGAGWLRGLLGIRKDLVDTKKAKLEVKKLQHEEKARNSPIALATFEDVKKYDPKYEEIERRVRLDDEHIKFMYPSPPLWLQVLKVICWLVILFAIINLILDIVAGLRR